MSIATINIIIVLVACVVLFGGWLWKTRKRKMKIELENGIWLARDGYPTRTLDEGKAKNYKTLELAWWALAEAREYRPFKHARIVE